jgi:hypothetical protein
MRTCRVFCFVVVFVSSINRISIQTSLSTHVLTHGQLALAASMFKFMSMDGEVCVVLYVGCVYSSFNGCRSHCRIRSNN